MIDNSNLFKKYKLNNNVEVPSLLTVAPMGILGANPDGTISETEKEFFKLRATNVGLYILGATCTSQEGLFYYGQPRAYDEKDIPSHKERIKIIKSQGALAINQLHHGGCLSRKKFSGLPVKAVSAEVYNKQLEIKGELNDDTRTFDLTDEEIKKIINDFGKATEISLKAGYDGIEIHGANNYLIQQFYSGYYNKRNDEWGGSLEKRMRFPLEIVDICCKIREKYNKPEFIIGYRFSPEEPFDDGITMTETMSLVRSLLKKPIQYIHVSQSKFFQEVKRGEGIGIPRLKVIHDEIKGKIALIGVGGLITDKNFNKALNSGYADLIGAANGFLVNKDLGILLKEGKGDKIELEFDEDHPEKYAIPEKLWEMILKNEGLFPPLKKK